MLDSFFEIDNDKLSDLIYAYITRSLQEKNGINKLSSSFDQEMNLNSGSGLSIFKHHLARKIIKIDLTEKINKL
ncbi:MAG: transposase protein [Haloplasmataceae bacterium]|jgi:hypothetical protein|nr:transposase protein [Haloplasmataceae bacterium]